jgi:hypothetical protein
MEGARASTQAWEDGEVLIGWVGGGGGRGVRERVAPWGEVGCAVSVAGLGGRGAQRGNNGAMAVYCDRDAIEPEFSAS